MTRKHRTFVKGLPVHVTQRGVNKCDIFANDKDRSKYLEVLTEASDKHDCPVHCYALMGNHVHSADDAGRQRLTAQDHAVGEHPLRLAFQQEPRTHRAVVRKPLPHEPGRLGPLPAHLLLIYRAEPGPCQALQAPARTAAGPVTSATPTVTPIRSLPCIATTRRSARTIQRANAATEGCSASSYPKTNYGQ